MDKVRMLDEIKAFEAHIAQLNKTIAGLVSEKVRNETGVMKCTIACTSLLNHSKAIHLLIAIDSSQSIESAKQFGFSL